MSEFRAQIRNAMLAYEDDHDREVVLLRVREEADYWANPDPRIEAERSRQLAELRRRMACDES